MNDKVYISEGLGEVCKDDVIDVVFDQEALNHEKYIYAVRDFKRILVNTVSKNIEDCVFKLRILTSKSPDFARYTISYQSKETEELHQIWAGNSHFNTENKSSLIYALARVPKDRRLDPIKSITTGRSW